MSLSSLGSSPKPIYNNSNSDSEKTPKRSRPFFSRSDSDLSISPVAERGLIFKRSRKSGLPLNSVGGSISSIASRAFHADHKPQPFSFLPQGLPRPDFGSIRIKSPLMPQSPRFSGSVKNEENSTTKTKKIFEEVVELATGPEGIDPAWFKDFDIYEKKWMKLPDGKFYPIEKIGEGKYYNVYSVKGKHTVKIEDAILDSSQFVIKKLNANAGSNARRAAKQIKADVAAYKKLVADNIPVPKCYKIPLVAVNLRNYPSSDRVWVVEKMKNEVSLNWNSELQSMPNDLESQKILTFVKKNLDLSIKEKREIITDFRPPSIMWNENKELCVVDFSDEEDDRLETALFISLIRWSNGSELIFNHLVEEFPQDIKELMLSSLEDEKKANGNMMPTDTKKCI